MRRIAFACVPLLMAAFVYAQTPASQPAEDIAADRSTPKGALKVYAQAIRGGEAKAMAECLFAPTKLRQELAKARTEQSAAVHRIWKAGIARYGVEGAKEVFGGKNLPTPDEYAGDILARLPKAKVTLQGERAAIVLGDHPNDPWILQREKGQWKLIVADTGESNAKVKEMINQAERSTPQLLAVAKDIESGKLQTPADAAAAVRRATGGP